MPVMDLATTQPAHAPRSALVRPQRPTPFWLGRARAFQRLIAAGLPSALAEGWMDAWDESTADLLDFRSASDFWEIGFQFALEEYRRGYRPWDE
jgi:hypothetical protein